MALHILNLDSSWSNRIASHTRPFTASETAAHIHWIGGWVGPRALLDTMEMRKSDRNQTLITQAWSLLLCLHSIMPNCLIKHRNKCVFIIFYLWHICIYHVCCSGTVFVLQHRMVSIPISWSRLQVSSGQFFDDKFSGLGCGIEPIC